jgi:hypothetical protein
MITCVSSPITKSGELGDMCGAPARRWRSPTTDEGIRMYIVITSCDEHAPKGWTPITKEEDT